MNGKDYDKFGTHLTKPTTVEEMAQILNRVREMVIFVFIIFYLLTNNDNFF